MNSLRIGVMLAAASMGCAPAEVVSLDLERLWTGTNGKTFIGSWQDTDGGNGQLAITSEGRLFRISPANLSEEDRRFIAPYLQRTWTRVDGRTFEASWRTASGTDGQIFRKPEGTTILIRQKEISAGDIEWLAARLAEQPVARNADGSLTVGAAEAFQEDADLDRKVLPVINQSDFGNKASDCVPSSFCNFLLWWDERGYLAINQRGDFSDKAEYIHSRIARYFETRNTAGTSMEDAAEGIRTYFERDLKDLATFRTIRVPDCSEENLRHYVTGANATLLEVSVFYGRKDEGSHVVALTRIEPNGDLIFNTWGVAIRGHLKVIKENVRDPDRSTSLTAHHYEIELLNKGDFPDWMINNEVRFEINPERWDGLTVIKPYRFKTRGQPSPPPVDPLMEPGARKSAPPLQKPTPESTTKSISAPPLPHAFRKPATHTRAWALADGGAVEGEIVACDDEFVKIRVAGVVKSLPIKSLDGEDRARAFLWRGIQGEIPALGDAHLEYQITKEGGIQETVHLHLSGDRFRIVYPNLNRSMVCDVRSGHIISRWSGKIHFLARLNPDEWLPDPPHQKDGAEPWEKLRDATPFAPLSSSSDWPSRETRWLGPQQPEQIDFVNPVMRFTCMESTVLWKALATVLEPKNFSREGPEHRSTAPLYGRDETSRHTGGPLFLSFCAQSKLVPVHLEWSNKRKPGETLPAEKTLENGNFRLDLMSFERGPQPAHMFQIPAAAMDVPVGRCRQITPVSSTTDQ